MEQETRAEIEKLHSRVSGHAARLVHLEAQNPHINAALTRIENSVDKLSGRLGAIGMAFIFAIVAAIATFVVNGGLTKF